MELLQNIALLFMILVATKAIVIGSEYSFHYWFKYRDEYSRWYTNRQTFKQYLEGKSK